MLSAILLMSFQLVSEAQVDSLENALKTATGDKKVKVLNELFRAYINSDPVKAIGYTGEALSLAKEINDQKGMAASYNNLGISYRNQGALDLALENYMESLTIYSAIQNVEGMASTKNNIANIYSMKKDYGQALKYFEDSHNGFIGMGDRDKIIGSMTNLGNLHSDLQLYDQALNYYTQAWKLSEKSENRSADPLSNIGNLYYRQGNYQRAIEYYQRAMVIIKEQNNKVSELALLANIGEVYTRAGKTIEAQRYLNEAFALMNELKANYFEPQILRSMATNYSKQGKMKEAYETMVKYDDVREKVYGEESSRKIAQMDVALDLREQEKKIQALEIDDQMKTLKLRNTQVIITSVVLGVVALVALANLFFMYKRLRK